MLAPNACTAAEIGRPLGRREYNIIGEDVVLAARLLAYRDTPNEILITKNVFRHIEFIVDCEPLGALPVKGKAEPVPVYVLHRLDDPD